jgi:uncharacterized protein YegL
MEEKMTDKNYTEVIAIIDRSGSMEPLRSDTIGGFNSFIEEQKKAEGRASITLVQFDDKYQIDYGGIDVNDVKPLDETTYVPRGGTALFDAVGRTVNAVGARLAKMEEDKRPGQVIILVITDGFENSSREFQTDKVQEMVKHQTEKYSWKFVYLGGGDLESQKAQGMSLGFSGANVYSYNTNKTGDVYKNLSRGVARSRKAVSDGFAVAASAAILTDAESKELEED